jgi:hypothetical protein
MASSEIQQKTIALGNQLVALLSNEQRADRVSQWMAHHIAEQILTAANSHGPDKTAAEEKCFTTILKLWDHRASFPNGSRPFESFEPILRALERLDPESPRGYYHSFFHAAEKPPTGSVEEMTELIIGLDQAARVVMESVLNEAVSRATNDETRKFLRNAVPHSKDPDVSTILQLRHRLEKLTPSEDTTKLEAEKRVRERIERLDHFIELAQSFRASLAEPIQPKEMKPRRKPK